MAGRTRTATQLIADVRQVADVEGAVARHPDSQILEYLNQGIAHLWGILRRGPTGDYWEKMQTLTTDGSSVDYQLNPDFLADLEVKCLINGNQTSLRRMTRREESIFLSPQPGWSGFPFAYRIYGVDWLGSGAKIRILPNATSGVQVFIYYHPVPYRLVNGTDAFDGYGGWELLPIKYAAREVALKDENQELAAQLEGDMAKLEARIAAEAPHRDMAEPPRVNDVTLAGRYRWRRRRWMV